MSKIINVATIGGMVMERGEESPEEPLRQFREAAQKLDGTGVDLVITCRKRRKSGKSGTDSDGIHGIRQTQPLHGGGSSAHSRRRKKQAVHSVLRTGRFSARNVS